MATNIPVARVSAVQGKAFARGEDGSMRELKVGDPIFEGDVVVALPGAQVDLAADDGRSLVLRDNETLTVDAEVFGDAKPDAGNAALLAANDQSNRIVEAIRQGGNLDELLETMAQRMAAMQAHHTLYDGANLVAFGVLRDPAAIAQA